MIMTCIWKFTWTFFPNLKRIPCVLRVLVRIYVSFADFSLPRSLSEYMSEKFWHIFKSEWFVSATVCLFQATVNVWTFNWKIIYDFISTSFWVQTSGGCGGLKKSSFPNFCSPPPLCSQKFHFFILTRRGYRDTCLRSKVLSLVIEKSVFEGKTEKRFLAKCQIESTKRPSITDDRSRTFPNLQLSLEKDRCAFISDSVMSVIYIYIHAFHTVAIASRLRRFVSA